MVRASYTCGLVWLEKIRLSITRLKHRPATTRATACILEKIRLSITRLKHRTWDRRQTLHRTWKDKTLDYEIETLMPLYPICRNWAEEKIRLSITRLKLRKVLRHLHQSTLRRKDKTLDYEIETSGNVFRDGYLLWEEKIRLSITRLKPKISVHVAVGFDKEEKIRLSITRLKHPAEGHHKESCRVGRKDKTLDYEIETNRYVTDW